jgi:D-beta-D-heptose 7-phosphate kinase/D-beta-D-heptose 1-phosphate adenosyltransferase
MLRQALAHGRGAKVLVVGDLMLDEYVFGNVERVSPEAPVQVLEWVSHHDGLGGAANVAQNLAALGCDVTLAGVVGSDDKGGRIRELLGDLGVRTDAVLTDASRPTTTKLRIMAHAQQMLRIDREKGTPIHADLQRRLLEMLAPVIAQVDGVVCSDYAKGVLTRELLARLRQVTSASGKRIVADPKGTDYSRYQGFDFISPNLKELEAAARTRARTTDEIVTAGTRLMQDVRVHGLLVTRGKDGMTLLQENQAPFTISTTAREVYDVTGAGDTVLAVFAMALFRGTEPQVAAQLANHAAGLGVAKLGAVPVAFAEIDASLDGTASTLPAKIVSRTDLPKVVSQARGRGKRIVFTNGCFDILHVGHIKLLDMARAYGDLLIVGVNSDVSVRGLKGDARPLISENERAHVLAALDAVDYVTIFPEPTPMALIEIIRPDVLVKGGDYTLQEVVGRDFVESHGGRVELVPVVAGFSTTELVRRIAAKHRSE